MECGPRVALIDMADPRAEAFLEGDEMKLAVYRAVRSLRRPPAVERPYPVWTPPPA